MQKKIKIGNNVWIGANVVIFPGVTISDNVTIGDGSMVKKDIQTNGYGIWHKRQDRMDCDICQRIWQTSWNNSETGVQLSVAL